MKEEKKTSIVIGLWGEIRVKHSKYLKLGNS